jgi:DNA-directed RNA polymerase specialized sigma24 family protein
MPSIDPEVINDSVEDAVVRYLRQPHLFDGSRSRLDTFISMIATHNALNILDAQGRRRQAEGRAAAEATATAPETVLPQRGWDKGKVPAIRSFMRGLEPRERQFLAARLAGERRTSELARTLGLSHLSVTDQRQAVKRENDKLRVRLRRLYDRLQ